MAFVRTLAWFGVTILSAVLCFGQTITVGSTTEQLTNAQRIAVGGSGTSSLTYYWPDGNIGALSHSGTNIIFAPTLNDSGQSGTVQTTLSNLNNWTSGLSLALPATNIAIGGSGAFTRTTLAEMRCTTTPLPAI